MSIIRVVGARPPFLKAVAVFRAIRECFASDGRADFEATTIYKLKRYLNHKLTKTFSATSNIFFGFFYGRTDKQDGSS